MKTNVLLLFFLSFFISSCSNEDVDQQELRSDQVLIKNSSKLEGYSSTRKMSTLQYSLFQNVEQFSTSNASYATAQIYCSEATVATIQFGYNGNPATKYELRIPGSPTITSASGNSFRTLSANLQPGLNNFQVCVLFNAPEQSANARIALVSIGGDTALDGDGFIDLVAEGRSDFHDVGGTTPIHSKCSRCGFLNSVNAQKCVSCGK